MNLPKRPRFSRSSLPHSGHFSPVGSPTFSLVISRLARARSRLNGS